MTTKLTQLFIACAAGVCVGAAAADDHHHRHHFPKDVDAFHGVLAPVWHSPPGKGRLQNACAKASEMESLAKDIRSTDASRLLDTVSALKMKCQGDTAGVEGALFDVHEAFHHLVESPSARQTR